MLVIFAFVVLTLASARVTRLITRDKIFFPVLQFFIQKLGPGHWFVYLIHCPYCTSVWTSLGASALGIWMFDLNWLWFLPAALGMSYLVAPVLQKFEVD